MNCALFKENLFAFNEGTIPGELRQSLEAHLAICSSCTKIHARFGDFISILELDKATEPNPFVSTRILQRIEAESEFYKTRHTPVWVRILQPVVIAMALLTGIFIGSYTAKTGNASADQLVKNTDNIQILKSDLYIFELTDEGNILVLNK